MGITLGNKKYKEMTISLPPSFAAGKIGIVTVTYNSALMLHDFFESLDQQTYKDFIVFVVDNASKDATLKQLRERNSERLVIIDNETNMGVAAGNNQGIRYAVEAGCEYVLLINNDVLFDSEMIARLMRGMKESECSMTVPMIYFQVPSTRIWAAGGEFRTALGFSVSHRHANEEDSSAACQPTRIDYAPTCCVLIRREVFADVGLMDERYFVYSDDVDFMFRARRLHISMFLIPGAKLWHKVNGLTGAESDFSYFYGARGRALFLYKHMGRLSAPFWRILHGAFDFGRAAIRKNFRHGCMVKWRGMKEGRKVALGG